MPTDPAARCGPEAPLANRGVRRFRPALLVAGAQQMDSCRHELVRRRLYAQGVSTG